MPLPYVRPWLFEIEDQSWCPAYLRDPVRDILTFLWTHRIWPLQLKAPYEGAAEVLERVIQDVEAQGVRGYKSHENLNIVDFGSGASGPLQKIERRINQNRLEACKSLIHFYLSDLNPMPASLPPSKPSSISYILEPVNVLHAPVSVTCKRHLRTFFLSFHHFNEDTARAAIADAMKSAESVCIFELQECDLASVVMILMIAPLSWLLMPFRRPTLTTLLFTYLVPLIPFMLVFDGLVSVYRTRSPKHILHLANLASLSLTLENEFKDNEDMDWKWVYGSKRHTWPFGKMVWVVGRKRDAREDGTVTETEGGYSEAETGLN
ncbi:hypothetical protein L204_100934 [Cryptococcus depauperatus]|nr:hypothetical protein L204_01133 [Cryptococcus depauperatus CBS 7855]